MKNTNSLRFMRNSLNKILILIVLTVSLPASGLIASDNISNDPLTLAIFPRFNPVMSNRIYSPLANYLSKHLDRKVILRTPKNFKAFWLELKSGRYDIVHYNQYHYVRSHKQLGYEVIVKNVEFNQATLAGTIIVRKDSGINTVSDLKGKKIVFGGGRQAMLSYIVARHLLQKNGLNKGDYIESFAKNPPNAIFTTYYKHSAASGSGDRVLQFQAVKKHIDTNQLRFLLKSRQLPHLPWAVKKQLPAKVKKQIQQIFLDLDKTQQGKKLLKAMSLDRLAIAKDSDYNPYRKIIKEVLNEDY